MDDDCRCPCGCLRPGDLASVMIHRAAFGTSGTICVLIGLALCVVGCTFLLADSGALQSPRDAMRALVVDIAEYARTQAPEFLVIAQNGDELLTMGDAADTMVASDYADAIDGLGREDLFYGYTGDNEPTPGEATTWMLSYLDRAELLGIEVLAIDYCWITCGWMIPSLATRRTDLPHSLPLAACWTSSPTTRIPHLK